MFSVRHCDGRSGRLSAPRATRLPAIQPVIELRKGVTGRNNLHPVKPRPCVNPSFPLPQLCGDVLSWKKITFRPLWFGCRFHVLSVGLFYFYAQRPEFPMWRCPACTAQQRDAPSLRQHITGCCCCHPCRSPRTYSSSPWSDPRGSPHLCGAACAR